MLERRNRPPEERAHIFLGAEKSAKEVACVLIYDEDTEDINRKINRF